MSLAILLVRTASIALALAIAPFASAPAQPADGSRTAVHDVRADPGPIEACDRYTAARLANVGTEVSVDDFFLTRDVVRGVADPLRIRAELVRHCYVPENLLRLALWHRSAVLAELVSSGLPVGRFETEWQAGRRNKIPSWVPGELGDEPKELRAVARMYRRAIPPPTRFAHVTYGTYEQGWQITRLKDSPVSDETLLKFATSVCIYFLEAECGPPGLVRRARRWAEDLGPACNDERFAGKVDPVACNVLMFYRSAAEVYYEQAVILTPFDAKTRSEGSAITGIGTLLDLYAAKHSTR